MTLRDDLARMEAEDAAATPGPWRETDYGGCPGVHGGADDRPLFWASEDDSGDAVGTYHDRALIASARTDRPALAEMVNRLAVEIRTLLPPGERDGFERIIEAHWAEAKKKAGAR